MKSCTMVVSSHPFGQCTMMPGTATASPKSQSTVAPLVVSVRVSTTANGSQPSTVSAERTIGGIGVTSIHVQCTTSGVSQPSVSVTQSSCDVSVLIVSLGGS